MLRPFALGLAVALFAVAVATSASPPSQQPRVNPSARLVYVRDPGAETCPDEAAIRGAVAARLGYSPFFPSAGATMMVQVSRDGEGYRAHIQLIGEDGVVRGTRDLAQPSPRCEDIVDTMALTMSLAIDPRSLVEPAPPLLPPPAPAAAPARAPEPPKQEIADKSSAARPRPSPLHLDAGFGPGFWIGAAPSVSVSGVLFARLRGPRWSAALEARGDLPASRAVAQGTVETWLGFGSLVPCFHLAPLLGCVVGSVGVLHATSNVQASKQADALHAAVGPRVGAEIALRGDFALWAHLDALWTLTPERLQIGGQDVYSLPDVSFGITAGASVRFF
jgi:hypothetical protein